MILRPPGHILVIRARPGKLFDKFYFLITNLEKETCSGKVLTNLYSKCGKAEYHQGEMNAAARTFSLSSSLRPKSHYRDVSIVREEEAEIKPEDPHVVGMANTVRLQRYMLVYQLLHIGRFTLHSSTLVKEAEEIPGRFPSTWTILTEHCSNEFVGDKNEIVMNNVG